MNKLINWVKRVVCKYKGHNWETYTVSTGYWSYDIEQAGYCTRCGYDTHGQFKDGDKE
jgi:hypothetical protein